MGGEHAAESTRAGQAPEHRRSPASEAPAGEARPAAHRGRGGARGAGAGPEALSTRAVDGGAVGGGCVELLRARSALTMLRCMP